MSVTGTVSASFQGADIRTVGANSNANIPVNIQFATAFTTGTGALGVQVLFQQNYTLSGTTQTLDLFTGLADNYGTAVVLAVVKGIAIYNGSVVGNVYTPSLNSIVVGNAASNPWNTFLSSTGTLTFNAGDWIVAATPSATGWAVGTSTNVNLLVTGTSGQPFYVALLGTGT